MLHLNMNKCELIERHALLNVLVILLCPKYENWLNYEYMHVFDMRCITRNVNMLEVACQLTLVSSLVTGTSRRREGFR